MSISVKDYVLSHLHLCLNKIFMTELFSETEYLEVNVVGDKIDHSEKSQEELVQILYDERYFPGRLVKSKEGAVFFITQKDSEQVSVTKLLDRVPDGPIINIYETIFITSDDVGMSVGDVKPIKTNYGKLILNYCLLINPFEKSLSNFSYLNNSDWNINDIRDGLISLLIEEKISVAEITQHFRNLDFISSYCELFVPSVNKKLLTIDPSVGAFKKELMEKHKDELDDQNIRLQIEDAVIAFDKKLLLADPETAIFATSKTFEVHRSKMFSNFGSVEDTNNIKDGRTYVESNLDAGLKKEELPVLFNEVRTGIAGRALGTAKAGGSTKEVIRFLMDNAKIVEDDCKTKRTMKVRILKTNLNGVLFRNIITNDGTVTLTNSNINKYLNTDVNMRSPQLCESKGGYCYKCCSYIWELKQLDILNVVPVSISSTIMMLSMAKMHGTKQKASIIDSLNQFIV